MPNSMTQESFASSWSDDDVPDTAPIVGGVEESTDAPSIPAESEPTPPPAWLRDIDEDTGYNILTQARNLPDKLSAFRDQAFGKIGRLEADLKKISEALSKVNTQVAFDPEPIKKILEQYDGELAKLGLHDALAQSIRVSPMDETMLSPYLDPLRSQLGEGDIGTQIVLSHYDAEELNAIVPPSDEKGNLIPETQRHKDFLTWYEVQPLSTQSALERFGPKYVHALRKFEKWEAGQKKDRAQSAGEKAKRLAGGQQPSGGRKTGGAGGPRTAEEAFYQSWNEDD